MRRGWPWSLCFLLVLIGFPGLAETPVPKAELPLLITSIGQSPDAHIVRVLSRRLNLPHEYDPMAPPEKVRGMKTVIIAVGASLKGFGAGGVSLESEVERAKRYLEILKAEKVFFVLAHVGGEGRREPMSNRLLAVLSPAANHLVVWKDGDLDGYFTQISQKHKIPLTLLDQVPQMSDVLKKMFGL